MGVVSRFSQHLVIIFFLMHLSICRPTSSSLTCWPPPGRSIAVTVVRSRPQPPGALYGAQPRLVGPFNAYWSAREGLLVVRVPLCKNQHHLKDVSARSSSLR